jgi:hypothetical protein
VSFAWQQGQPTSKVSSGFFAIEILYAKSRREGIRGDTPFGSTQSQEGAGNFHSQSTLKEKRGARNVASFEFKFDSGKFTPVRAFRP